MKRIKSISLFFCVLMISFVLGFGCAFKMNRSLDILDEVSEKEPVQEDACLEESIPEASVTQEMEEVSAQTIASGIRLNEQTKYVLLEYDCLAKTVVETSWPLPPKYVGLSREDFVAVMQAYQNSPPLSEKERGLTAVEVKAFSGECVIVQKNYCPKNNNSHYYLGVRNHEVVVYLEDGKTIYFYTGLNLDRFPTEIQKKIMSLNYIEDEKELFDLLESYSS